MKVELNGGTQLMLSSVKFSQFAKNDRGDLFFHASGSWHRIQRHSDGSVTITAITDGGSFKEPVEVLPYGMRITLISENR